MSSVQHKPAKAFLHWKWQFVEEQKKSFINNVDNYLSQVKEKIFDEESERDDAIIEDIVKFLTLSIPDAMACCVGQSEFDSAKKQRAKTVSSNSGIRESSSNSVMVSSPEVAGVSTTTPTRDNGALSTPTPAQAVGEAIPVQSSPSQATTASLKKAQSLSTLRYVNDFKVAGRLDDLVTLAGGLILVAVYQEWKSMIILYNQQGQLLQQYEESEDNTYRITMVNDKTAAVLKQKKTLQFLNVSHEGFTLQTNLDLGKSYEAIVAVDKHTLALSYHSNSFPRLDFLSLGGILQQSICTLHNVDYMCKPDNGDIIYIDGEYISRIDVSSLSQTFCIKVPQVSNPRALAYIASTKSILVQDKDFLLSVLDDNGHVSFQSNRQTTEYRKVRYNVHQTTHDLQDFNFVVGCFPSQLRTVLSSSSVNAISDIESDEFEEILDGFLEVVDAPDSCYAYFLQTSLDVVDIYGVIRAYNLTDIRDIDELTVRLMYELTDDSRQSCEDVDENAAERYKHLVDKFVEKEKI